ncbi:MAG: type I-E CRISPR-associated protein Cas7/Cse4/CasC [Rubrivivax sp.]|nr:type I-E CRISPR-associated protein Cas7/Cse4/CasC [Rubrivivax sp.]
MSRFVQLHVLTAYPPANLNRDDTGRPKTALVGDAQRLRISSQSLKRAWRTSDVFAQSLGSDHLGQRTKRLGIELHKQLVADGVADKPAREWARKIAGQFGKLKADKPTDAGDDLQIEQLAHVSPEERADADQLARACAQRNSGPADDELKLLRRPRAAVDIAMFGRMLADAPAFNVEAAVQVAHAITVHKAAVEDDYFSAVDDLNQGLEDKGAGHIGERGYGAGLFYLYLCIDRELLTENLGEDLDGKADLTRQALRALLHAVTQVAPTGMQNSYGSRAHASYLLAEKGNQQPRSLVQAFLKPVRPFGERDMLALAVEALQQRCANFDKVYGACADDRRHFDVEKGEGSLAEVIAFVAE